MSTKIKFLALICLVFLFNACAPDGILQDDASPATSLLGPVILDTSIVDPYVPLIEHSVAYFYDPFQFFNPEWVFLQDQFATAFKRAYVYNLAFFANAVEKNDEGIQDTNAHWTWYRIDQPIFEPERKIVYQNQFTSARDSIVIGQPNFLLVPAGKFAPWQPDLDHYKCYEVLSGNFSERVVKIYDPCYGTDSVQVDFQAYFCPPCAKKRNGMDLEPIKNETDHVFVYGISPVEVMNDSIRSRDQFLDTGGMIQDRQLLTVPTKKLRWSLVN